MNISVPGKESTGEEAAVYSLRSSKEAKGAGPDSAWRDLYDPR